MESYFPNVARAEGYRARDRVLKDLKVLGDDTRTLLSDKADEAQQYLRGAAKKADTAIRTRPYESVAVALVAGIALGWLLSGPKKRQTPQED